MIRLFTSIAVCIFLIYFVYELRSLLQNPFYGIPRKSLKYISYRDPDIAASNNIDVQKLQSKLETSNKNKTIQNNSKFRPIERNTPILLVQVDKDIFRLQYLIVSLTQVHNIESVLLIFSHRYYDERIDDLVKSIDFCKVMQIFFPHSLQLHPYKFPGIDPIDCKSNRTVPIELCVARDAALVEDKQHWWWSVSYVFEMEWTKYHESIMIFLQEDNYVLPDLLHMAKYLQHAVSYFSDVDVISFGKTYITRRRSDLLILEPWQPLFHIGLAFNLTVWKKIKLLSAEYCMYDDYNWSYSLLKLFEKFQKRYADMIACMTPRVLSTSIYTNDKTLTRSIRKILEEVKFFPENVKATFFFGPNGRMEPELNPPHQGIGGWKDLRDQYLCLDVLSTTTTEEQRYYDYGHKKHS